MLVGSRGEKQTMNLEKQQGASAPTQTLPPSQEPAEGSDHFPKEGEVISLHVKSEGEVAATVTGRSQDELSIDLVRLASIPFKRGQQVRIKYWAEGSIAYYWEAKVVRGTGKTKKQMKLKLGSAGVTVQRRTSFRVPARVPLSGTVIESADSQLAGATCRGRTKDISVGGLAFETDLPLKVGDKLAVKLQFSRSREVDAVGWVLRSERIAGGGEYLHSVAMAFLQYEAQDQNRLLQFLVFASVTH